VRRVPVLVPRGVTTIRGLEDLTEPGPDEPIGGIIDIPVIGARGDGKSQFIVQAIRSLRAVAPTLRGPEAAYNHEVMSLVMNAQAPRPEATAPGVVPHYTFRVRDVLAQLGPFARLGLLGAIGKLWVLLTLALLNGALVLGVLVAIGHETAAPLTLSATGGALLAGLLLGWWLARRTVHRRGGIEVVFWDVAGEHVYSGNPADYYNFLATLVHARRQRASSARTYTFAPVLVCNPVSLGTDDDSAPYLRLRKLMPTFAAIAGDTSHALVAINRWRLVERLCEPDRERAELVGVVARSAHDERTNDDTTEQVAVVRRDVVRRFCLDSEDERSSDEVRYTYLRYDAGVRCAFQTWPWNQLDEASRQLRRRLVLTPSEEPPNSLLTYRYSEGPGAFEGEARTDFFRWIGRLCAAPQHALDSAHGPVAGESGAWPAFAGMAGEAPRPSSWTQPLQPPTSTPSAQPTTMVAAPNPVATPTAAPRVPRAAANAPTLTDPMSSPAPATPYLDDVPDKVVLLTPEHRIMPRTQNDAERSYAETVQVADGMRPGDSGRPSLSRTVAGHAPAPGTRLSTSPLPQRGNGDGGGFGSGGT
jgi:hypothetical protein